MARIRSVHPSLFTDDDWVSCSAFARLFYIGLWTDADDQGLFVWKPLQLKMKIFPGDSIEAGPLLDELVAADLIASFSHAGSKFGAIKNFRKYQRPKKPNAVHFMPEEFRTYVALDAIGSEPDGDDPTEVPHQTPTKGGKSPQMEDGGWRGEEEVSEAIASSVAVGEDAGGFEALWKAYPHVKGRSSKPRALEAWLATESHLRADLPAAAKRYANGGTIPAGGAPALAKWLEEERWRDWTGGEIAAVPDDHWTCPDDVRAAFVADMGLEWARSYIDHCGWQDVPERALIPASRYAGQKLVREARAVLSKLGLTVLDKAA